MSFSVVLLTFIPRIAFDLIEAISFLNNIYNIGCSPCGTCQLLSAIINLWLDYTPEFQIFVVASSSPLPLAVSLWCMMTDGDRKLLREGSVERGAVKCILIFQNKPCRFLCCPRSPHPKQMIPNRENKFELRHLIFET